MFFLQVLSIDASDSSPCIVIGTATQRFLFESGEGTQRLCLEHKVRLARLHSIFITQICPSRITGLPGLMLTTADTGKASLNLVGPIGIKKFWDTTKYFYHRPNFNLKIIENNNSDMSSINELDSDELMVSNVPIVQNNSNSNNNNNDHNNSNNIRLCYICETYKSIGKFDVAKAVALKVPKGPLYGKLKSGQSVKLDDGTIINPEDVLDPEVKGRYALIICNLSKSITNNNDDKNDSNDGYLESCINNSSWIRFQKEGTEVELVDCIVHMSSLDVLTSKPYQSWMNLFGENVEHIFVGRGACYPHSSFIASTKYINKLNKVSPIFQKLLLSNGLKYQQQQIFDNNVLNVKIIPSRPLIRFNMLPAKTRGYVESMEGNDTVDKEVNEFWDNAIATTDTESLMVNIENVQSVINNSNDNDTDNDNDKNVLLNQYDLGGDEAKMFINYGDDRIWFLGTGSAIPSKYRNVSGILLQLHRGGGVSSILLDVGEGTWQQMMKMALNSPNLLNPSSSSLNSLNNEENIDTDLIGYKLAEQIKVAWISHPHADHHLGLIRLLSERKRLLLKYMNSNHDKHNNANSNGNTGVLEPILLIAPPSVLSFVRDYEVVDDYIKDSYLPLSCRMFDRYDNCTSSDSYWFRSNPSSNNDSNGNNNDSSSYMSQTSFKSQLHYGLKILNDIGIEELSNVKVVHCNESYGVAITLVKKGDLGLNPFKIVYSGDTRPCRKLIELGRGASLLIHEATFDDTKGEEAKAKRHSTVNEALTIAKDMNVFRVILTHFSQRYPKIPPMPETLKTKAVLAFDYMTVTFRDLLWTPALIPLLSEVLPKDEDDDNEINNYTINGCSCCLNNNNNNDNNFICNECNIQRNDNNSNNNDKRKKHDDVLGMRKKNRLNIDSKL